MIGRADDGIEPCEMETLRPRRSLARIKEGVSDATAAVLRQKDGLSEIET